MSWFTLLALLLFNFTALAGEYPFTNLSDLGKQYNFQQFAKRSPRRRAVVAIFDTGFKNVKQEIGSTLPKDTSLHMGPQSETSANDAHGVGMAQIVNGLMTDEGRHPEWAPKMHLFNTSGLTNLQAAVKEAIAMKVDIILYAQVWEFGNNWDGGGYINDIMTKATNAGITVINAAGNFGTSTFNSAIEAGANGFVKLPDENDSLLFECRPEKLEENAKCPVRIVLSWNVFTEGPYDGTDRDLDLLLYKKVGQSFEPVLDESNYPVMSKSRQLLKMLDPETNQQVPLALDESLIARELIQEVLEPGIYYIRIIDRSHNFEAQHRLRVVLAGPTVNFRPGRMDRQESLLTPADHAQSITVGAMDSERTSVSVSLGKPEVFAPSTLKLKENNLFGVPASALARDTSTAAAVVTAAVGMIKSFSTDLGRDEILKLISREHQAITPVPMPRPVVENEAPKSWREIPVNAIRDGGLRGQIVNFLEQGGRLLETRHGFKLALPLEMFEALKSRYRGNRRNDLYLLSTLGLHTRQKETSSTLRGGLFDVLVNEGPSAGARVRAIELIALPLEVLQAGPGPGQEQPLLPIPLIPMKKTFWLSDLSKIPRL